MEFSIASFKPLYNWVLVKPQKTEAKTKSGIIIAGDTKVTHETGEVIAVGHGMITPGGEIIELHVKKGDTVVFGRGQGIIIKETVDGQEYLLFKETELLGICSTGEVVPFARPV